eukprot:8980389-Pyramimonas_sp.AAC.1
MGAAATTVAPTPQVWPHIFWAPQSLASRVKSNNATATTSRAASPQACSPGGSTARWPRQH